MRLDKVRGELDLAGGREEGALAALDHGLERVVGVFGVDANDRMLVELFPRHGLTVEVCPQGLVVSPGLEGLLVDSLLRVHELVVRHAGQARVELVDDAQALGDLRPHPFLRTDLAGEIGAAAAEGEVVAHAVRAAHEALVAVHVLVHALELPYGSRQDDIAHLSRGLVDVPLEAPVEFGVGHALQTLVGVGVVVGVVVLEDEHLHVG